MSGAVIIVLLIVLSGLIAYFGDRIGMKAGKKRISLFGLRPRYSSIIITVVTGILIAGLSITILLFTYSSLRQALFNINEVLQRLESLNQQLTLKDQELTEMQQQIADKTEELSNLQEQRDRLQERLGSLQQEFEQDKRELEQDIASLQENREELRNTITDLRAQRGELEQKITELNNKISELNEDYEAAKRLATQYRTGMIYYMGEDIVYQKGDIIYSEVITGGRSEERTIQALNEFLQRANQVAKEKPIKVDQETGMALKLQTEDIMNAARVIYNMEEGQKVIVSLVAPRNVPRNDWLWANFLLNKDFIVFETGELIADVTVDAGQETDSIENRLRQLLSIINEKSIEEGLLPDVQGQVGSLDFSRFYDLLNEIRDMSGIVKIEVYAREDIWREDRLVNNLDFTLQQVEGE